MEYQPKVVLCRLHMAGKTIQQIREECAGQGMTYRDFENIQRANEYFDGVRCRLSFGSGTITKAITLTIGTRRTTNA